MKNKKFNIFPEAPPSNTEHTNLEKKYSPKFQNWKSYKAKEFGYLFELNYKADTYNASCVLPLAWPLPEIKFTPVITQPKKSWLQRLANLLLHPAVTTVPIIASCINIIAIIIGAYSLPAITFATIGVFSLQALGLGLSIGCVSIAILAYVVTPILKRRLIHKFDLIEEGIKLPIVLSPSDYAPQNKVKQSMWRAVYDYIFGIAVNESTYSDDHQVKKIGLIYQMLIHEDFPGTLDLKWRYHYLNALSIERQGNGFHTFTSPFIIALKYATTDDQKFLCLRNIFNSTSFWAIKYRSKDSHEELINPFAPQISSKNKFKASYDELVEPFVPQISSAYKLHQELRKQLKLQLDDCILDLVTADLATALEKFSKIKFDAYSKKAYPDLSVMYYQLDAIITILGRKEMCDVRVFFEDNMRLANAYQKLAIINANYIYPFYPDQMSLYTNFFLDFQRFRADMPTKEKPYPGKPIINKAKTTITRLPDSEVGKPSITTRTSTFFKIS